MSDAFIFVLGGLKRSKMLSVLRTGVYYELATRRAPIACPEMNVPRMRASGFALNQKALYVFGGLDIPSSTLSLTFIERLQLPFKERRWEIIDV